MGGRYAELCCHPAMGRRGDWREISISLSISTSLACQVKYAAKSRGINRVIQ